MSKITLDNIGPLPRFEIDLQEGGGVFLIRGPNGAGKTIALEAVADLLKGEGRPPVSDGAVSGRVEGLGATILLGRRTTRGGEIEVRHIEGVDPSMLVDPGIKDLAAADAARIKTLCVLAGVDSDWQRFAELLPDDCPPVDELLSADELNEDLPSVAARLKRVLEARARTVEKEAEGLHREALGIRSSAGEIPEAAEIDEKILAGTTEEAVRRLATLEGRARAAREALARGNAARVALAEDETPSIEDAEAAATTARADWDQAQGTLAAAKLATAEATATARLRQQAEAAALATVMLLSGAEATARQRVGEARVAAARIEELRRAVASAASVEILPESEIVAARAAVTVARQAQDAGAVARNARVQRERAVEMGKTAARLEVRAGALREAAWGTESVLSAAIGSLAPQGLRVEESRLVIDHEARGRAIPFAELSHGERWRIALVIGAEAVGQNGILVARQEAWEGLDPDARIAVDATARALHLTLLSGQADSGEIRVEKFKGGDHEGGDHA